MKSSPLMISRVAPYRHFEKYSPGLDVRLPVPHIAGKVRSKPYPMLTIILSALTVCFLRPSLIPYGQVLIILAVYFFGTALFYSFRTVHFRRSFSSVFRRQLSVTWTVHFDPRPFRDVHLELDVNILGFLPHYLLNFDLTFQLLLTRPILMVFSN